MTKNFIKRSKPLKRNTNLELRTSSDNDIFYNDLKSNFELNVFSTFNLSSSSNEIINETVHMRPLKCRNNLENKEILQDLVVTAIYDYLPNQKDELKLYSGDKIRVLSNDYRDSGAKGWCVGLRDSQIGVFPMNYVKTESNCQRISNERFKISSTQDCFVDIPNIVTDNNRISSVTNGVRVISSLNISRMECLGSGAYGVVYRGKWKNKDVAVKTFSILTNEMHIYQEAGYLSCLLHHNIVRLFGVSIINNSMGNQVALVMEYARGGCLHSLLHFDTDIKFSLYTLLLMSIQIASGMKYLHNQAGICHRDLKSSNVLIKEEIPNNVTDKQIAGYTLLITDFGMARKTAELVSQQSKFGTLAYAAPEVCKQQGGFTVKSDVWSYGVLLWELLTLEIPYRDVEQPHLFYKIAIKNQTLYIPSRIPNLLVNLLTSCWDKKPDARPDFDEVLRLLNCARNCKLMKISAKDFFNIQKLWQDEILSEERFSDESMTHLEAERDEFIEQHKQILQAQDELQKREADMVKREAACNEALEVVNEFSNVLSAFISNGRPRQSGPLPPLRKLPFVDRLKFWGHTSTLNSYHSCHTSTNSDNDYTGDNLNISSPSNVQHVCHISPFVYDVASSRYFSISELLQRICSSRKINMEEKCTKIKNGPTNLFPISKDTQYIKTKNKSTSKKSYGNSLFYDFSIPEKNFNYAKSTRSFNLQGNLNSYSSVPNILQISERDQSVDDIFNIMCVSHNKEGNAEHPKKEQFNHRKWQNDKIQFRSCKSISNANLSNRLDNSPVSKNLRKFQKKSDKTKLSIMRMLSADASLDENSNNITSFRNNLILDYSEENNMSNSSKSLDLFEDKARSQANINDVFYNTSSMTTDLRLKTPELDSHKSKSSKKVLKELFKVYKQKL